MPDTPISGATSSTYTLVTGDIGANIFCRVTAHNSVGDASADSNTVGPVTAASGGATTTFDPANTHANLALSSGNLTATSVVDARGDARSIASASSGKKYFELLVTAVTTPGATVLGIANASVTLDNFAGVDLNGVGLAFDGSLYINNTTVASAGVSVGASDVVCMAIDFGAEKLWVRKNGGTWYPPPGAGDPTDPVGTGLDFSSVAAGPYYVLLSLRNAGDICTANFGATAYTYTVPSGYGNF